MKKIWRKEAPLPLVEPLAASVGADRRVYAIGDIHGRADLFDDLLRRIDADNANRPPMDTELLLLGDLVDRGPQSADVVRRALELRDLGYVRFLKGNHEEVFVRAAQGDEKALRFFIRIGGRETILSYGLSPQDYDAMDYAQLMEWVLANIPREHVDFIADFEDIIEIGDYAFVHAGIRPDVPLDAQKSSDLRWIRDEFLSHSGDHGRLIVHGHTITQSVDICPNRIGIDTGAYASGRLTAIGLEGGERWYLEAQGEPGEWTAGN